jgi:hypothetical protein
MVFVWGEDENVIPLISICRSKFKNGGTEGSFTNIFYNKFASGFGTIGAFI